MKLIDDIILVLILSLASCTDATSRAPARWMVSTLAGSGTRGYQDGAGTAARFNSPIGMDVDSSGNIYVADRTNNRIRMITPGGEVSTFVNSGEGGDFANVTTGTAVRFAHPEGVAVDLKNDTIYVAEYDGHRIRKITKIGEAWEVSTLAGSDTGESGTEDGVGTTARFNSPIGMDVDSSGNIYVADHENHRIRMITPGGEVSTFVGSDEGGGFANVTTGTAVRFNLPTDVAVDSSDTIYVADTYNHRIQKITAGGVKSILAGSDTGESGTANGIGTAARFNSPQGVAVDLSGNVYVADYNNDRIQKITPGRVASTLAGSGTQGSADGTAAAAQFKSPTDVVVDSSGIVYVIDSDNHRIRKIEYRVP